jgi:hypothetical protein
MRAGSLKHRSNCVEQSGYARHALGYKCIDRGSGFRRTRNQLDRRITLALHFVGSVASELC